MNDFEEKNINISIGDLLDYYNSQTKVRLDQAITLNMGYFTEKTVIPLNDKDTVLALLHFIFKCPASNWNEHSCYFTPTNVVVNAKVFGVSLKEIAAEYNLVIAQHLGYSKESSDSKDLNNKKEILDAITNIFEINPTNTTLSSTFESVIDMIGFNPFDQNEEKER